MEAARYLHKGNFNEGAIARAYFALFAAVKGLLLTENLDPKTHKGLNAMLGLHFVKTGRLPGETGTVFSQLRTWREQCDYNMQPFTPAQARQALDEAERMIRSIEALICPAAYPFGRSGRMTISEMR